MSRVEVVGAVELGGRRVVLKRLTTKNGWSNLKGQAWIHLSWRRRQPDGAKAHIVVLIPGGWTVGHPVVGVHVVVMIVLRLGVDFVGALLALVEGGGLRWLRAL